MKINEVMLNESLSQVLYHLTTPEAFYNIARNDEFQLQLLRNAEVLGDYTTKGSRYYFASFARSPSSAFIQNASGPMRNVMFEIDGRYLSANYAGAPVDYFAKMGVNRDEMEDRLYSHKPVIDNFGRYVDAIHIYIAVPMRVKQMLYEGANILKDRYDIDVFVYQEKQNFKMLRNGMEFDEYDWDYEFDPNSRDSDEATTSLDLGLNKKSYEKLVHAIEFLRADSFNELSADAQQELAFMQGSTKPFAIDVKQALNDVSPSNKIVHEFTKDMRRHNIPPNDIPDSLARVIEDKWL